MDTILQWMKAKQNAVIQELIAWSCINTHVQNHEGLAKQRALIAQKLASYGCTITEVPLPSYVHIDDTGSQIPTAMAPALVATQRPEAQTQLLLSGHMDTVFSLSSPFQKTSFQDEDHLIGPGVADMKGGLLVALLALEALEKSAPSHIGWTFVINPDEEIGSPSSRFLLTELAKKAHYALVFEPAFPDGAFVSKRAGSQNLTIVAKGKSAHAGRDFMSGRSALFAMAACIADLEKINHSSPRNEAGEQLVTLNVGALHAKGAYNIIPDLAVCRMNIRATEASLLEEASKQVYACVEKQKTREGISFDIHEASYRTPTLDIDPWLLSQLKACAESLNIPMKTRLSRGVSDANIFSAAKIPTLDTLGPIGMNLHTEQEMVYISSIVERAQLAYLLMMRLHHQT